MAELVDLERRITLMEERTAIEHLKYAYWRHLDLKQWEPLRALFAADATVNYSSGKYEFRGIDAIMKFLTESLSRDRGAMTIHHGHHPEIEITGPTKAKGTWALYNYMYNVKQNRAIRIGAYYHDDYVKLDGAWKFQHIGYQNIFHEEWKRDDLPSINLVVG
ncbi:MAG: nuclear transport factor 2 family protein [Deltaproteobacteria bacterium]|nr:nuclear transport factor 2 family protein [Deltaproteobacteria bacterium]